MRWCGNQICDLLAKQSADEHRVAGDDRHGLRVLKTSCLSWHSFLVDSPMRLTILLVQMGSKFEAPLPTVGPPGTGNPNEGLPLSQSRLPRLLFAGSRLLPQMIGLMPGGVVTAPDPSPKRASPNPRG
jgi:hypothetical protein